MILIINGGSSSLKASLFTENLELVSQFHLDQIGLRSSHYKFVHDEQVIVKKEKIKNHLQGIKILINFLPLQKIKLIGHRVVHGGDTFVKPTKIDLRTLYRLEKLNDLAPLHNPVNLEIIKACRKTMKKIPNYAIFDTAYYSDLPKESSHYALPDEFMKKFKIRKYGFHGISHKYVTNLAIQNLNIKNPRIISCHLGGGCSVTASKNGKALETSMGFTPLSGVVMGTRSGDIDPEIILYLIKKTKYKPEKIKEILNKKSGLLALSKISSDMRDIYEKSLEKNKRALETIDFYSYQLAKYISSYLPILGGLDCLVFTGGIGENAFYVREKVVKHLNFAGLKINGKKNKTTHTPALPTFIEDKKSSAKIAVITTNEAKQMALELKNI